MNGLRTDYGRTTDGQLQKGKVMTLISKIYDSTTRRVLAWSRKGRTKEQCEEMMSIKHKKPKSSKVHDPGYSQEEIKRRIARHKGCSH